MNDKIKNAFHGIHADESLKKLTFDKIISKQSKKIPMGIKLAPVLAVFVVFLFGYLYFTPVSHISIDINPSIELSVNRFDRVIGVAANNEDARVIVNSISLNNLSYTQALEKLDSSDVFSEYGDIYTEITVVSSSDAHSEQIIENISNCSFYGENVQCFSGNLDLKNEAEEQEMSFGKYRAYLELLEIDGTVDINEIRKLPMRVIRDMIENNGELDENLLPNGNGQGLGNGNQSGDGQGLGNGNQSGDGQGLGNGNQSGDGQGLGNGNQSDDGKGLGNGNQSGKIE